MRIIVVGCHESRRKLAETLAGLGYSHNPRPLLDFPEKLFAEAANLDGMESQMMFYHPVDVVIVDAVLSADGVSWQEVCRLIKNSHNGFFVEVKVAVMPPSSASSGSCYETEASRIGMPFLKDPGNKEDVRALLAKLKSEPVAA